MGRNTEAKPSCPGGAPGTGAPILLGRSGRDRDTWSLCLATTLLLDGPYRTDEEKVARNPNGSGEWHAADTHRPQQQPELVDQGARVERLQMKEPMRRQPEEETA